MLSNRKYHRQNNEKQIMKKNYITPATEIVKSGIAESLLMELTGVHMGEPAGEGEDITAESKAFSSLLEDEE